MDKNLNIPEGLSELGKKAAETIISVVSNDINEPSAGGCTAFHSPQEWAEEYGRTSLLVIVHDGGDLARYFNYYYEQYAMIDKLQAELDKLGLFAEQCTSWYSAVYKV